LARRVKTSGASFLPLERHDMKKQASAVWTGGIKDGSGKISTASGALDQVNYGFKSRFEDGPGTNPEELVGAAHAGCFTMALSLILGQHNLKATQIDTKATITLEQDGDGFTITASHLDVVATIPGATAEQFAEIAHMAELGCPVSKLLKATITMDARLA
jgi:osmotically inducible protein OsmC